MMRVGLTGGIGSGKSSIAREFTRLGVPVYNSDLRAKELMQLHEGLRAKIKTLLGSQAYNDGKLDRGYVASRVFSDSSLLQRLNSLVHPRVREDFERWAGQQQYPYVIQEAAVLFENGGYRNCDKMILVVAPEQARIERVIQRDKSSRKAVVERMKNQWPDDKKIPLADFVIENSDWDHTLECIAQIHSELLEIAENNSAG
ncbi:dephospho-CoA kinase [Robiginitalea sp. IMCC44478]|uniref:dephospho-CoA kinase n=1 Tax=Robiginitalea sp. IMCC44478 TaxID=3459122 RepID=UPI00404251B6